jgi:hypothetical protein
MGYKGVSGTPCGVDGLSLSYRSITQDQTLEGKILIENGKYIKLHLV